MYNNTTVAGGTVARHYSFGAQTKLCIPTVLWSREGGVFSSVGHAPRNILSISRQWSGVFPLHPAQWPAQHVQQGQSVSADFQLHVVLQHCALVVYIEGILVNYMYTYI